MPKKIIETTRSRELRLSGKTELQEFFWFGCREYVLAKETELLGLFELSGKPQREMSRFYSERGAPLLETFGNVVRR